MDSPKFMTGVMIGALVFVLVMVNLWLWNIVPVETMREFDSNPIHVYMIIGIALASMFGSGLLCAAFFDREKK